MGSGSSPPEKTSPVPLLGSQGKQNGATHVTIPPQNGKISQTGPTGWRSQMKLWARHWAVTSVVLNLILIISIIILVILLAQPAKKHELSPTAPACPVAACPDGWVGYLGRCYYFSEVEADWTSSQNNCSAHGASLAGIDTQQEMDFMMRYKGPSDYWIGLRRAPDQPWKWTNGTEFNNWFTIRGAEKCAFLNHVSASSSRCSGEKLWLCSKPVEKTEGPAW
uniref:C-type lectin domain-containing protein n=1 Tax=Pelusios castaneus TaxID=367368 RepID=A0A8C8RKG7_9SAUR